MNSLSSMRFTRSALLVVARKSHRFHASRTIDVTQLAEEPVLVLDRSFESREWLDVASQRSSLRPHVILESKAPQTILALANAGHGVAIIPSTVSPGASELAFAPLVHERRAVSKWLTVSSLRRRFFPPFADASIAELCAHCQSRQPGKAYADWVAVARRPKRKRGEEA